MMSKNTMTGSHASPKDKPSDAAPQWSAHQLIFSLLIVGLGGFELMMGTFIYHLISSGHAQGVPLLALLSASPMITLLAIGLSSRKTQVQSVSRPAYLRVVPPAPVLEGTEPSLEP